jgi:hypothetical protein
MLERICNGVLKRGDERRCWHFVTCYVLVCARLVRVEVAGFSAAGSAAIALMHDLQICQTAFDRLHGVYRMHGEHQGDFTPSPGLIGCQ